MKLHRVSASTAETPLHCNIYHLFSTRMRRIIIAIYKLPLWKSIIILILLSYIIPILIPQISNTPRPNMLNETLFFGFYAILLAPLMETFTGQILPYYILKETFGCKVIGISICSGIIFGLYHLYSPDYAVHAGIVGCLYQLWYIVYKKHYSDFKAFLIISSVHADRKSTRLNSSYRG